MYFYEQDDDRNSVMNFNILIVQSCKMIVISIILVEVQYKRDLMFHLITFISTGYFAFFLFDIESVCILLIYYNLHFPNSKQDIILLLSCY